MDATTELRKEIAEIVLTTENEDIITQMFNIVQQEKNRPCKFTDEEILLQVEKSERSLAQGKVISLEEIEKRYI